MAAGGLGALAAAAPLEFALKFASWRDITLGLAVATVLVAALLWSVVPDKPMSGPAMGLREQLVGVRQIFSNPHYWRYAPMGLFFTGGFMAIQGLWATRWMSVMEALPPAAIAQRLTWMSASMLAGFLFMGFFATRLVHRGIRLEKVYLGAMITAALALTWLTFFPNMASGLLWPVLGFCFSLSNMSYSLVAQAFPTSLSGRANTALNLLIFAGAFGLQWGIGFLVDALQGAGWALDAAYRVSFITVLGGQALALLWLIRPGRRS